MHTVSLLFSHLTTYSSLPSNNRILCNIVVYMYPMYLYISLPNDKHSESRAYDINGNCFSKSKTMYGHIHKVIYFQYPNDRGSEPPLSISMESLQCT